MRDILKTILSQLHPEVDFEREKDRVEQGILDSFDVVCLVSEIDGELGITIPAEALTPENFCSLDALYQLLLRQKP